MSPRLAAAIDLADASGKPVVIFIHGLWHKPNAWDRWAELFEAAGYATLAPRWPAEIGGAAAPETIAQAAAYITGLNAALHRRPALIGHAFGGLVAQLLASREQSVATVSIDPPPSRGDVAPPRSPLLIIAAERDHHALGVSVEPSRQAASPIDYIDIPRRGLSPITDYGWHEVAQPSLRFIQRFQPPALSHDDRR